MNNNFNQIKQVDLFIFAGGRGTRINKYTKKYQKCMIKINSKPFLYYLIKKIKNKKIIKNIFILSAYKASEIKNYFINSKKIKILNEKKRTGTYGALLKFIKMSSTKFILVMNGDTYVNYNIDNFKTIKKNDITILTKKVQNSKRYGHIKIKKNQIIEFKEKKSEKSGYINLGIAIIKKKIIKDYSHLKFQNLENEIFSKTKRFRIGVKKTKSFFIDIGTYKSLALAKKYFK
jgi:NDP-sugar pyrophosphorylase family protein